ncbi:bleomycin hydrolase [Phakopsora pachyrhizi]|uniref:Cysteine proteinase 1, mitochondrial n=1 Tax=Phakopsora pachyrhizi TaxID=170000 RepID=A0AAV0BP36_PHAPC|nr:bleomycin hydrolase [Phakopsora pachyrhizi]CAH7688265.1 bleomycin hydrolase [Phakopsora pachyrhizi]
MGSQSSKPTNQNNSNNNNNNNNNEKSLVNYSSRARSDAASTAALLSRLNLNNQTNNISDSIITLDNFTRWRNSFEADDKAQLASVLLTKLPLGSALIKRSALAIDRQVFSHTLTVQPTPVTNQKSSGRCWLFATCNVIRVNVIQKFNLGDFELSQSYLFFYDALEKANYYLENIIELIEEPLDSRIVAQLSSDFEGDGGQWDMVVGLIEKYGIVPKTIYDESYNSSNSGGIKSIITSQVRTYALELRKLYDQTLRHSLNVQGKDLVTAENDALSAVRQAKQSMIAQVYKILAIALGSPPSANSTFKWEYNDVNGKAHSLITTPLDFYHKHTAGFKASEYISLINDPRHDYDQSYTVNRLGNVWGGRKIRYVNTTSENLKALVIKMIKSDKPVWFGCDVGKMSSSTYGIMDTNLIDYENGLGVNLTLNKSERLQIKDSAMTHAMVITAVHLDSDGKPIRFKVENSWSESAGDHGYFVMTNEWFDEFVYQIVLPKSYVTQKLRDVYEKSEATVLPLWDPMGSLA